MANNLYTTKTAALKATKADINKLDAKKMLLNGKNILEYIKESSTIVLDERGTKADDTLDIWNSYVTKDEDGNVIINRNAKPFEHAYNSISSTQFTTLSSAVKVIDGEVLGENNAHLMYWQTDGLTKGYFLYSNKNNIREFKSDLSSLLDGNSMFKSCTNLTSFKSDLPSLTNGSEMFKSCTNLTSFKSDLPSLTNGSDMFKYCSALTTFSSDLSSLTNGCDMFKYCSALKTFNADLSSLTSGYYIFSNCSALTSFTSGLQKMTDGEGMFYQCTTLTSFSSDLSSLTYGTNMFKGCSSLESFSSALSSLWFGKGMFEGCKLDTPSVANIIHFIPKMDAKPTDEYTEGNITIGLGITNTDAAKQAFAEECYCTDWAELNKEFDDKNWGVRWQFNGPASYSLRDPRPSTTVYTKLEEVFMPTEEEIAAAKEKGEHIETPHYEYTSQDGSKFYNIHWYHDSNTNNEGYDCFESLEMATLAYSVIPKENIISTEE